MSSSWLSMMVVGAGKSFVAPERWVDVWGDPFPKHAGALLKQADGRKQGSPAISALHVVDDHTVLIGFGDWQSNDGPTALTTIDPTTGESTVHGVYPTEAFETFRTIDGVTYALFVDPTGFWEDTLPYATYPVQDTPVGKINAIHVFDIVKHEDTLWVCGSSHDGNGSAVAAVWYSEDNGATWTRTTPSGKVGDLERASRLGVGLDGRVSVLLNAVHWIEDGNSGEWYSWNGTEWERGGNPGPDPHPAQGAPKGIPGALRAVFARTSTHWLMGTTDGDIYSIPAD